jgi:hypothetical protein
MGMTTWSCNCIPHIFFSITLKLNKNELKTRLFPITIPQ